jgi:Pseudouridine synthase
MKSLLRTRSGAFTLENALTLEEAERLAQSGRLKEKLLPTDFALGHLPRVDLPARYGKMVANGAKIPLNPDGEIPDEGFPVRVYLEQRFWGIAEQKDGSLQWRALISPEDDEDTKGMN